MCVKDPIMLRCIVNALNKTLKRPLRTPFHQKVTDIINVIETIKVNKRRKYKSDDSDSSEDKKDPKDKKKIENRKI